MDRETGLGVSMEGGKNDPEKKRRVERRNDLRFRYVSGQAMFSTTSIVRVWFKRHAGEVGSVI